MKKTHLTSGAMLAFSILVLPGCKWFNGCSNKQECSEQTGCTGSQSQEVLLSIEGSPALTVKDIDSFIDQIAGADEQVKAMLQNPEYKERIYQDKKRSIILGKWAKDAGVREKKEYRDKEKNVLEAVRTQLDAEEFVKHHTIDVTDTDAKKYYDESKNQDPRILISPEGIKAAAVVFDTESAANDFAKNLKDSKKDIEKLAKDKKLTVLPLGIVNNEAFFIDAKVKDKIMSAKHMPDVIVVKGDDNKYWVAMAQKKETAQYRPFDKVKDTIKQVLKSKKTEEVFETELKKIEQKLNIVENKQYFQDLKQPKNMMPGTNPMLPEEPSNDKELAGAKGTAL